MVTMEHIGIEIRTVRPDDGSYRRIDVDLSEQLVVTCNVFEHGTPKKGSKVYNAIGPVRESKVHDPVVQHFHVGYVDH